MPADLGDVPAMLADEVRTRNRCPHEYQAQLACGERRSRGCDDWLSDSIACESMLIEIPTGFGKTGAVVLAWSCRARGRNMPMPMSRRSRPKNRHARRLGHAVGDN